MGQGIPTTLRLCRAPDLKTVKTIFNVFSYDNVLGRDSNCCEFETIQGGYWVEEADKSRTITPNSSKAVREPWFK